MPDETTQPTPILCSNCGADVLIEGFGVSTAAWIHRFYAPRDGAIVYLGDEDEIGDNLEMAEQMIFCRTCGSDLDYEHEDTLIDLAYTAEYSI